MSSGKEFSAVEEVDGVGALLDSAMEGEIALTSGKIGSETPAAPGTGCVDGETVGEPMKKGRLVMDGLVKGGDEAAIGVGTVFTTGGGMTLPETGDVGANSPPLACTMSPELPS